MSRGIILLLIFQSLIYLYNSHIRHKQYDKYELRRNLNILLMLVLLLYSAFFFFLLVVSRSFS